MRKRLLIVVTILITAATLLTGCGYKSAIIGEWQGTLATLTFDKDGTVFSGILGFGTQGTYEFVDNDTIRITGVFGDSSTSSDLDVKIENDTLYLTDSSGITLSFQKAK